MCSPGPLIEHHNKPQKANKKSAHRVNYFDYLKELTETDQENDSYVLLKTYRVFNLDQITGFTMPHPIQHARRVIL